MSRTATPAGPSGLFATARRGGLTAHEITEAERLRALPRPMSWQHIAARTGRCAADYKAHFARAAKAKTLVVAPPVACDATPVEWTKDQIATLMRVERKEIGARAAAKQMGCSPVKVVGWQAERLARGVGNGHRS